MGVDLVWFQRQGVASAVSGQQGGIAEHPAQLRHLGLQGVPADRDGLIPPEVLDQPVGPDRLAGVQREPHQQLARFPGRDPDPEAVAAYLDRPQHGHEEHASEHVRCASAPRQRARPHSVP